MIRHLKVYLLILNQDASIQRLYHQRKYKEALDLTISFLDKMEAGSIPVEGKADARDRELLDIAMKCAIRLRDPTTSNMTADRSKHRWGPHSSISATAAEAYIIGGRPRGRSKATNMSVINQSNLPMSLDAISALLQAVHIQSQAQPHLRMLIRALGLWTTQLEVASPIASDAQLAAIRSLHRHVVAYCDRSTGAFSKPLFSDVRGIRASPQYIPVSPTDVAEWCARTGFEGDELRALVSLVTFKAIDESSFGDETAAGKSVRSL